MKKLAKKVGLKVVAIKQKNKLQINCNDSTLGISVLFPRYLIYV